MDRRHLIAAGAIFPLVVRAQEQSDEASCVYLGQLFAVMGVLVWTHGQVARRAQTWAMSEMINEGLMEEGPEYETLVIETKADALAPFAAARAVEDVMEGLEVPAAYQEAHEYIEESIAQLLRSGDYMQRAVIDGDVDAVTQAQDALARSQDLLDLALAAIAPDESAQPQSSTKPAP